MSQETLLLQHDLTTLPAPAAWDRRKAFSIFSLVESISADDVPASVAHRSTKLLTGNQQCENTVTPDECFKAAAFFGKRFAPWMQAKSEPVLLRGCQHKEGLITELRTAFLQKLGKCFLLSQPGGEIGSSAGASRLHPPDCRRRLFVQHA